MDPVDYLAALSGSPETFLDIHTRLIAATAAATPSWTPEQTNTVVTLVFGDFDAASLSNGQVLQLSLVMNDLWPPYPLHNTNRHDPASSRTSVLLDNLAGHIDSVATLRRPCSVVPCSLDPSNTPAHPSPPVPSGPPTPPGTRVAVPPSPPIPAPDVLAPAVPAPHPAPATPEPVHPHAPPPQQHHTAAIRSVFQFYTPANQYGADDDESLSRAVTKFRAICNAIGVPPSRRAACVPFALRQSEHNLPAPVADADGATEHKLWSLVDARVNTDARALRVRDEWQTTTLATTPPQPNDTPVSRFTRMVSRLALLQAQMPGRYQTAAMLLDKILDATRHH